jgi:DNA-directed RNA polymerase subunit RPC12/RpoP
MMSDDLVSKQAVIEHLSKRLYETALNNVDKSEVYTDIAENRLTVWVDELPSVQPKEKTGQWIDNTVAFYRECSECGALVTNRMEKIFLHLEGKKLNYCPNCGAKMEV